MRGNPVTLTSKRKVITIGDDHRMLGLPSVHKRLFIRKPAESMRYRNAVNQQGGVAISSRRSITLA